MVSGRRRLLWLFLSAVSAGGVLVVALVLPRVDVPSITVAGWIVAGLVLLTELRPVRLPLREQTVEITVSPPFLLALLLLEGLSVAVVVAALASLAVDVARRKPARKIAFNASQYALKVGAAGWVFAAGQRALPLTVLDVEAIGLMALAAAAFTVVNVGLVSVAVALDSGASWSEMAQPVASEAATTGALLTLAPIVFVVAVHGTPLVVLFLVPVWAVHRGAELVVERRHAAWHDAVTGLPNHAALLERGAEVLQAARAAGEPAVLLLADLDRFRELNNNFGHETGDTLLRSVAERMEALMPAEALCARVGGDEFGVLLVGSAEDGLEQARRLRLGLAEPFTLAGLTLPVQLSIGLAVNTLGSEDTIRDLVQRADVALYLAKDDQSGIEVYSPAGERDTQRRLVLTTDLQRALDEGEASLHYQPCVEVATGRILSVEALFRWEHPLHGPISPGELIPMLEQTVHIHRLTRWVLDTALAQCRAWRDRGAQLRVAVNLSVRDLDDGDFPALVLELLAHHGVPGTALELEVTESALMDDPRTAARTLSQLSTHGIRIAIDDFGTGHASLSYLKWLPVNALKIDRSFIRSMVAESTDAAIVETTVDLAHRLGLEVTAEGVEDAQTWTALAKAGCDHAQGFHLARPMPPAELGKLIGVGSSEVIRSGLLELHAPRLGQEPVAEGHDDDGRPHSGGGGPEPAEDVDEDPERDEPADSAEDR